MDNLNQPNQQTPNPQYQQNIIIVGKQKSVGVAFLLAFLFGPLGLLYASVTGGIVMFILGVIISIVTLGFGLIVVWIACIIWAVVAANNANSRVSSAATVNINAGAIPRQQSVYQAPQQQPVIQAPPLQPIPQQPSQTKEIEAQYAQPNQQEANIKKTNDLSLNTFSDWVTNNKKGLMFGLGGVVIILILVVAIKYVVSVDFAKSKHEISSSGSDSAVAKPVVIATPASSPGPTQAAAGNNPVNNGEFTGRFFDVKVPQGFSVRPSLTGIQNNGYSQYISAFFQSPDSQVEFYIFSGYFNEVASDVAIDPGKEKQTSILVKNTGGGEVTTWTEIKALDNSYFRAYQETKSRVYNEHKVVGLRYNTQAAYNAYKSQYLA
ncbi:MAG TPA: hypothetical protein VFE53_11465, partial [Mucilaginibacter sp.]|nr:hypothetical protein [Mucilaginibacter sp.]